MFICLYVYKQNMLYITYSCFHYNLYYRKVCWKNIRDIGLHILYPQIRSIQSVIRHFCAQTWSRKLVSASSQQNTHYIDMIQNYSWTYIQNSWKESDTPGCLSSRESDIIGDQETWGKFIWGYIRLYLCPEIYRMFVGREPTQGQEMAHK